jgi:hypothetical protein
MEIIKLVASGIMVLLAATAFALSTGSDEVEEAQLQRFALYLLAFAIWVKV